MLEKKLALVTALILPFSVHATTLNVKFIGSVTSVDTSLQSEFSVGESVEFGFSTETAGAWNIDGGNTSSDATAFVLNNPYFRFGSDYYGSQTGAWGAGFFWDKSLSTSYYGPQYFSYEGWNLISPNVNGMKQAEIYVNFGLIANTFSGANDPYNIITASELLALNGSKLDGHQQSSLSFNQPNYQYVRFSINNISVSEVPLPGSIWLFSSTLIGLLRLAQRNIKQSL